MKLSIKRVDSIDIGHLRKLTKQFIEETKPAYPILDDEEIDRAMLNILANKDNPDYVYLIAYDGKKPAGFFIGFIGSHPYGKPRRVGIAQELYVVPNKRNKRVGFKLIQQAVKIALQQGIEGFECCGSYNGTDKRWERYGFNLHLTYGWMPIENMLKLVRKEK